MRKVLPGQEAQPDQGDFVSRVRGLISEDSRLGIIAAMRLADGGVYDQRIQGIKTEKGLASLLTELLVFHAEVMNAWVSVVYNGSRSTINGESSGAATSVGRAAGGEVTPHAATADIELDCDELVSFLNDLGDNTTGNLDTAIR